VAHAPLGEHGCLSTRPRATAQVKDVAVMLAKEGLNEVDVQGNRLFRDVDRLGLPRLHPPGTTLPLGILECSWTSKMSLILRTIPKK
jgi:hypothetical protein